MREWHPDVVLLDIMLPRKNGIEAAMEMRSLAPEMEIVLVSGQAETSDLLRSARNAGYDFPLLAKPVAPADLLRTLREATGGERG